MKKLWCISLALMMMLAAGNVSAVTVWIGDDDGFGWLPTKVPTLKGVDKKAVDRVLENKKIQLLEVVPDVNQNGKISYFSGDNWDNRSAVEKADIAFTIVDTGKTSEVQTYTGSGSKFTDVTLSKTFLSPKYPAPGLANDVVFTFKFPVPDPKQDKKEPWYGQDHVFSLVYGDYEVEPMLVNVDGAEYKLESFVVVESGPNAVDGLVQTVTATVPWTDMEDGEVVVKLLAPNEPYTMFDYAVLDAAPVDIGPYPLCANEEIPLGTHYIVDTGAAKSMLDKATLAKGVQLTVLSPRSANCKPKTTGKGEPGHYLHCSDTFIANRNYFVFPESMAEEISVILAEKETTEGDGLVFTILSRDAKDCPLPEKGDKPKKIK